MSADDCNPRGIPRPALRTLRIPIEDVTTGTYIAVSGTPEGVQVFDIVTTIMASPGFGAEPGPTCYHVSTRFGKGHDVHLAGTTVSVLA